MDLLVISNVRRARFVSRPSRFTVVLSTGKGNRRCHLHDPGRLTHLLKPGTSIYYREAWRPGRATSCDVVAVEKDNVLVLEDTRLGNQLFPKVASLVVPGASELEKEKWINGTRIDFVTTDYGTGAPLLIEVKSTNLVVNNTALFPDAPSKRAHRQIEALLAASLTGARAVMVFTVLRSDAEELRINRAIDPRLARLVCANKRRLELYAYRVEPRLVGDEIRVSYRGTIPVNPC